MAKSSKAKAVVLAGDEITERIHVVRGQKVMFDFSLAELYEVETKRLNEQVKRNKDRFPEDFMFRLTAKEWNLMRSQIATASIQPSDNHEDARMRSQIATASKPTRNTTATPFAFTEHGVTMLASVLKSERAVKMSIAIVRAFIELKKAVFQFNELAQQLEKVQLHLGEHDAQLIDIQKAIEALLTEKNEKQSWNDRKRIGFKSAG